MLTTLSLSLETFVDSERHHDPEEIHRYLGGYSTDSLSSIQKSTEIVYKDGTVIKGPDMPAPRAEHCALPISNGSILIMGGLYSKNSVILYDHVTSQYSTGPSMLFRHSDFGCAHFRSDKHEGRPVVLSAGGYNSKKAELLDYTKQNAEWEASK